MQYEIERRFKAVEIYINQIKSESVSEQTRSYLCRFGTVLICGNIERSIEIVMLNRLQNRAHPRVINFIKSHFQRGTNFDCSAIKQLLNRFDPVWYRKFSDFVDFHSNIEEGVGSCYSVRNSVAHGGTMSIGVERLSELFDVSRKLIEGVIAATK